MSGSQSIVDLLVSPDAFRAWLREKKPLEVVGEEGCARCPLARFLREARPETRYEVGREHFWVAWGRPVELPAWAASFVRAADRLMSELGPRPRVYAHDALALLDDVPRTPLPTEER